MEFFRRRSPDDVIYLTPVQLDDEHLPEDKIRMLCCDAKGNIRSTIIENSVYELAKSYADELERTGKKYAILSVEIVLGKYVPYAVAISQKQLWALEHILDHALKRRQIPAILKKYLREIIQIGEHKREELRSQYERLEDYAFTEKTPEVLHRLTYYTDECIEAAIPIYKAQHRYPLIVLQRLPANEQISQDMQRLLTLDSDGDLAIIRLPSETADEAERNFEKWKRERESEGCIILSRYQDGFKIGYLEISQLQRKALDLIVRHFAETGYGQQPISTDAQAVLARAKEYIL